jgi:GNAT superfamily N-acetyltransferase
LSEQSVGEVIRLATYDDRALVAALRRAWVEENSGGPIEDDDFERRFDEWLRREEHQRLTWLGLVDDQPVAMVNMLVFTRMPRPGTEVSQWGYLANFYVRPENRDAGLGTRLLAALTAYADEHGFVRVILSPSERSVPFYERGGFSASNALMLRTPASVDGTSPHR